MENYASKKAQWFWEILRNVIYQFSAVQTPDSHGNDKSHSSSWYKKFVTWNFVIRKITFLNQEYGLLSYSIFHIKYIDDAMINNDKQGIT